MRRWGIIVTAYYAVILIVLLLPGAVFVGYGSSTENLSSIYDGMLPTLFSLEGIIDGGWFGWLAVAVFATSQALLLFLSVDTSRKRLPPRQRVTLSATMMTFAVGALTLAALSSIGVAIWSDDAFERTWLIVGVPLVSWGIWAVVFYVYRQRISERFDRAVNWLLGGSVLQLLVAVPCHIIVRNRGDCCAPGVTAYGIATGIAVMLMAFGPSVLFLYQKRLRAYKGEITAELKLPRRIVSVVLGALMIAAITPLLVLPAEDDWIFYPEMSEQRSEAATTAVVDLAQSFGLTAQSQNEGVLLMLCSGDLIGRVQATPATDSGIDRWVVSVRADQVEFVMALQDIVQQFAAAEFPLIEPATVNRWRVKITHGTLLGGGCDRR